MAKVSGFRNNSLDCEESIDRVADPAHSGYRATELQGYMRVGVPHEAFEGDGDSAGRSARPGGAMGYLSIIQLATFMVVVEEGTMTKAAGRLRYSQPAVSGQIRALELAVGTPLLRRGGRGSVTLTEAGDRLLLLAPILLQIAQQILQVGSIGKRSGISDQTISDSPRIGFR